MVLDLDLNTMKQIKVIFDFQADESNLCNGYKVLKGLIKATENSMDNTV